MGNERVMTKFENDGSAGDLVFAKCVQCVAFGEVWTCLLAPAMPTPDRLY